MDISSGLANSSQTQRKPSNQNIQVYARVRPLNARERCIGSSSELVEVVSPREIVTKHTFESKHTKKFTFDRTFGPESKQVEVYTTVVGPLIEEVLQGYNCTVFAYGQTGTGKTYTMVGPEVTEAKSSWEDDSHVGIIPRALSHLFEELRLMELDFSMRISYLELYNEELCDLLSSDDSVKIRIFEDSTKKGSVIIQGLEEIPVHSKNDVYKLLEKGKERRRTAATLMNAQSSRSHTVFSILVHIRENGIDGEEMLKIGKLNLVDLAGSENVSKAGNEGKRARETVNINQSLLTLGRVIMALVERTPHVPYRESKLTRLLQESLGGRTKTSIIATISPGHKDIEETLNTLEYAHRAKNIQNKPEVNQKLTKKVMLKEYTEEIDKLKRDLMAARDKNGIYLAEETYAEMNIRMESQNRELNEKVMLIKALRDEMQNKEKIFNEVSLKLVQKSEELCHTNQRLAQTKGALEQTSKVLHTTKRRYKEKKVLLESHVKTEQELTEQATKILEVADIATTDTEQLHNTIERRKDVDRKIESACETFTRKMHDNFSTMNQNLNTFRHAHKSSADLLLEEITNSQNIQGEMLAKANENIASANAACHQLLDNSHQLQEEFMKSLNFLSDEHQEAVVKAYADLLKSQAVIKSDLLASLYELQAINEKQKSYLDEMHANVVQQTDKFIASTQQFAHKMEAQLSDTLEISQSSMAEYEQLHDKLIKKKELAEKEEEMWHEVMQKMQQFKQERRELSEALSSHTGQAQKQTEQCIRNLEQSVSLVKEHTAKQVEEHDGARQDVEGRINNAKSCVDQNFAKCSTVEMQLDHLGKSTEKAVAKCQDLEKERPIKLQENIASYEENVKRMRMDNDPLIEAAFETIGMNLQRNAERMQIHMNTSLALKHTLENQVEDYGRSYEGQMDQCINDVDTFRDSELKTYKPTGTTPSKKEFSYPRVLKQTLPHAQIVRQYRQENDWSDLDVTVTIDEDSEGEQQQHLQQQQDSVQSLSDTETILNSTPIGASDAAQQQQQQSQLMERSRQSSNASDNNFLKPANVQRHNSLMNNSKSPSKGRVSPQIKASPILTLSDAASLKDNKENFTRQN